MMFVHAVFNTHVAAARAVAALVDARFRSEDIGALLVNRSGVVAFELKRTTGIGAGAVLGAVLGAIGGVVAVTSGLVAGEPLFLAASGTLAGAVLGVVTGTLGGLGFWHERIELPRDAFENGAVLVGVCAEGGRIEASSNALKSAGATEVRVTTKRDAEESAQALASQSPRI